MCERDLLKVSLCTLCLSAFFPCLRDLANNQSLVCARETSLFARCPLPLSLTPKGLCLLLVSTQEKPLCKHQRVSLSKGTLCSCVCLNPCVTTNTTPHTKERQQRERESSLPTNQPKAFISSHQWEPNTKGRSFNGSLYETSSAAYSSLVYKRVVCSRSSAVQPHEGSCLRV